MINLSKKKYNKFIEDIQENGEASIDNIGKIYVTKFTKKNHPVFAKNEHHKLELIHNKKMKRLGFKPHKDLKGKI